MWSELIGSLVGLLFRKVKVTEASFFKILFN